jgi:hypothetical protein
VGREPSDTLPACTCPRCGYDQRGIVDTWAEACPLDGRCSECGLEFAWADVLRPDRQREVRFVEHAPASTSRFDLRVPLAAWRTLVWSLTIWLFARRVKMQHKTEPRRWWTWVMWTLVVPVVVSHTLWAIVVVVSLVYLPRMWQGLSISTVGGLAWLWMGEFVMFDAMSRSQDVFVYVPVWQSLYFAMLSFGAAVVPLVASETLGRVKVQRRLVLRAVVFSLSPALFFIVMQSLFGSARWMLAIAVYALGGSPDFIRDMLIIRDMPALIALLPGPIWVGVWWLATYTLVWKIKSVWTLVQLMLAQLALMAIAAAFVLLTGLY